ncbi:formylmethanofuran dehydrogenase [Pseudodesulfovibrio cashew]|uniref:Formylmethanofuran dehydrogenase n=1 Tax=Pseudodesulfovibrio cashew TaxID=2678688 RepID=A0A6I6J801_9BACT|nr:FmdE family protein [Pseudodesulfovibrio cashew]QGY38956.1 formylmethanofuran dehydrogenase [Pseudodesulfovibrio cashew]
MPCTIPESLISETISFHGHVCPGLSIGIRASELAMRDVGDPREISMVAVSETDMCGVDAIQFLTGCTFGKGNFIHRDYGKMAFSFYDRDSGKGIRAVLNTKGRDSLFPEYSALVNKEAAGKATDEDRQELARIRIELQKRILAMDLDALFDVTPVDKGLPRPARVLESLVCAKCGESVMESRTRRLGGETLCIPCFTALDQKS